MLLPFKFFQIVSVRHWVCACADDSCVVTDLQTEIVYVIGRGQNQCLYAKRHACMSGARGLKHQQLLVNISPCQRKPSCLLYLPLSRGAIMFVILPLVNVCYTSPCQGEQSCLLYFPLSRGIRACAHTEPFCVWPAVSIRISTISFLRSTKA